MISFIFVDNPYDIACKFISDNNLNSTYLDQVVEFIIQNTGPTVISSQAKIFNPYLEPKSSISSDVEMIYETANLSGILKKILEFAPGNTEGIQPIDVPEIEKAINGAPLNEQIVSKLQASFEKWQPCQLFPRNAYCLF